MSRRLIFHIGMGKTGSTSIQRTLEKNRAQLRTAGILYPKLDISSENHRALGSWLFNHRDEKLSMQVPGGLSFETFSKAQYELLLEQAQGSDISYIILSCETFSTPLTQHSVDRLTQLMQDLNCGTMTPLIYVRDPAAWFLSRTQQALKAGYPLAKAFPSFSYERIIRLIRSYSTLPDAEMMVRCFDRSKLVGGDSVIDFMTSIGLGDFPLDYEAKPYNVSLSMEAVRYLENHNTDVPRSFEELTSRRRMMKKLKSIDLRLKAPTKPKLKSAVRNYIYSKDGNLAVLRQDYQVEFPSVDYSSLSKNATVDPLHLTSLDDLCEHNEHRLRRLSQQMKLPLLLLKIMAKLSKMAVALRRPAT